jgi:hypothetical protein
MRNIEFLRLRDNEFEAIVAISKQILVAKDKTWAERRSDNSKLWKNRLHRRMKRRPGQRLEINVEAAPGELFAPLPNRIRLHSHRSPFVCRTGVGRVSDAIRWTP